LKIRWTLAKELTEHFKLQQLSIFNMFADVSTYFSKAIDLSFTFQTLRLAAQTRSKTCRFRVSCSSIESDILSQWSARAAAWMTEHPGRCHPVNEISSLALIPLKHGLPALVLIDHLNLIVSSMVLG
jgi:putative component of membrane protein insertase Oxa1/YidC/SpoIIIJ protein YidD